ncbi:MAG: prolyl oligopeptidase family serine peptidase [Anaerolineales bacterium]|nr:prolyl oligopeptidase family serine peptidase [Anaerolineales bacterium]
MSIQTAPYGTWKSPITTDLIVANTVGLGSVVLDGEDIYWIESRPTERGRNVIVKRTLDGVTVDVNPAPFNARTRAHEYGGGAYCAHQGTVYFSNFADQRLYRVRPGDEPLAVTAEGPLRFADGVVTKDGVWMYCVVEDHSQSDQQAVNAIGRVKLADGAVEILVSGNDFYSSPKLSPDEGRVAWLTWNHPNMPWDGTELWVAEVGEAGLSGAVKVAGGEEESVVQPEWMPDGTLLFISDRTGWWNMYRWEGEAAELVVGMAAEFGYPQWVFGMSSYGVVDHERVMAAVSREGHDQLLEVDVRSGKWSAAEIPFDSIGGLRVASGRVVFGGGSPRAAGGIHQLDLKTHAVDTLKLSSELQVDMGYLSIPKMVAFPTENGLTAFGYYYAPQNKDFQAPAGEQPPLIVFSHGGPTGSTSASFSLSKQYWTSRGFAILDVDYGGSTGYGRAYRQRLNGNWGVVDVDDCVNGAKYLAEQGIVDGARLAIRGGSAGGYTTLAALTFRKVFKAGASYYGIGDLTALARDTHKFESRYLDSMVGPYPEREDVYLARSPLFHVEQLATPVIFFQGLEDQVVPPNQAEMMVDALRKKGVPVAYVPFEGEQHGFRQAKNIQRSLEAEYYFYAKVFGFEPADEIEPVEIENL